MSAPVPVSEDQLSDLRHRLRTPLNHIIGYSELLLEESGEYDADTTAQLRSIRAGAHGILSLVQHRLSPDEQDPLATKIDGLRSDIADPLNSIISTSGILSQRLRGPALLDLLRINAASMDLFWFAQGKDLSGRTVATPSPPVGGGPGMLTSHPARILIVDDDPNNCDVLNRQLARAGHTATCVHSGRAALSLLREQTFDLVLLDVIMPELSGFAVLQELKTSPSLSSLPVIMLSALDELESAARCIQMGAEDYLLKPLDPVLLRARLHSALERTRLHEDLHRFAFAASHDLQEPLRTVVSTLQLLMRGLGGSCTPEQLEFFKLAVDGAKRMSSLISDLLAYSMASSREPALETADSELAMDDALTNLRHAVEESHARITRDPLPEIRFDQARLTQLFQNLIGNAVKYRGDRPPEVHVRAERDGDRWVYSVRDNGNGIESKYFRTIFEPFRRLHGRDLPGTGLGLAICEKIVQGFGGRMWVESEPGRGSVFYFSTAAL